MFRLYLKGSLASNWWISRFLHVEHVGEGQLAAESEGGRIGRITADLKKPHPSQGIFTVSDDRMRATSDKVEESKSVSI